MKHFILKDHVKIGVILSFECLFPEVRVFFCKAKNQALFKYVNAKVGLGPAMVWISFSGRNDAPLYNLFCHYWFFAIIFARESYHIWKKFNISLLNAYSRVKSQSNLPSAPHLCQYLAPSIFTSTYSVHTLPGVFFLIRESEFWKGRP